MLSPDASVELFTELYNSAPPEPVQLHHPLATQASAQQQPQFETKKLKRGRTCETLQTNDSPLMLARRRSKRRQVSVSSFTFQRNGHAYHFVMQIQDSESDIDDEQDTSDVATPVDAPVLQPDVTFGETKQDVEYLAGAACGTFRKVAFIEVAHSKIHTQRHTQQEVNAPSEEVPTAVHGKTVSPPVENTSPIDENSCGADISPVTPGSEDPCDMTMDARNTEAPQELESDAAAEHNDEFEQLVAHDSKRTLQHIRTLRELYY